MTAFLVRASVADLGCALEALCAIDVLYVFAEFVAVAVTTSTAWGTVTWAILTNT